MTITELQQIIDISNNPLFTNAVTAFNQEITTTAEITALKEHYFNVVFFFDQVMTLVEDERTPDYGCNSPAAMIEYIQDRATEASASMPTDDELDYTEPDESAQSKTLYWIDTEASGSASGSASASVSAGVA